MVFPRRSYPTPTDCNQLPPHFEHYSTVSEGRLSMITAVAYTYNTQYEYNVMSLTPSILLPIRPAHVHLTINHSLIPRNKYRLSWYKFANIYRCVCSLPQDMPMYSEEHSKQMMFTSYILYNIIDQRHAYRLRPSSISYSISPNVCCCIMSSIACVVVFSIISYVR